jgi:tryptophan synthase alpha chain
MSQTLASRNLLDDTFRTLQEQGKSALMPFITLGDPTCEITLRLLLQMEQAGADIIELGIPYSDPLADGPVIERASARALRNHVSIADGLRIAAQARKQGAQIPYVLFTYYNPVLQFGLDSFLQQAREAGISGIIIPDLPYEESHVVREAADRMSIHLIPLVAPTSESRVSSIVAEGRGFIYCVSSLGVTGVRDTFDSQVDSFIELVQRSTELPIAIGFGISTAEHVKHFATRCDGVIVGSAIVRRIEEALPLLEHPDSSEEGILQICDFVRQLKH